MPSSVALFFFKATFRDGVGIATYPTTDGLDPADPTLLSLRMRAHTLRPHAAVKFTSVADDAHTVGMIQY